jgi:hypothetical protein
VIVTTFRDRVAQHFLDHPLVWFDGLTLASHGGAYAWRSRVSDCRTQLGMAIENRERREGRRKVSEYRYVPSHPPQQTDLLHSAAAADSRG